MYKKILVPFDGSALSECALSHVKEISQGLTNPEIILVHVLEPEPAMVYETRNLAAKAQEKEKAEAEDYLCNVSEFLKGDNITVNSVVIFGSPAEAILNYALKNEIDLIVMSTHGRSGPSLWAFGSVADKVIRSSTIPVLTVVPKDCRLNKQG
jgi:nucleotide-binding universal stress UspA family protein